MVKASKHRNSNDTRRIGPPLEQACSRHALSYPLVRARGVEIPKAILLEHLTEVPFAEDNNVVETLAPDAAEKPLAKRIHERSLNCRPKNVDAGTGRGATEIGAELAVVVADDELGPDAEGCGFPELLRRPLRGGVSRNSDTRNLLRVDVPR
jgi:hypothetical protein